MPPRGALSPKQHRKEAANHARVGDALMSAGEEGWAAVCFFYSAYHLVKAALMEDPIFNDPSRLSAIDAELIPDDRHTERHKGRKKTANGREWGVNELVLLLYRPIAGPYNKLHQASIDVRYHCGLRATASDLRELLTLIQTASDDGELVWRLRV